MTQQDRDYPWVFHRDEIDVLEDELEDLYEAFHDTETGSLFESAVLGEQLETEERSDRELSSRLGFDVLEPPPPAVLSARQPLVAPSDPFETWQQELVHVRSHPLYQQAKRWAIGVKSVAKQVYEQGGGYAGECFRVYANVNLVPLKIFTALCEEMHEDDVGCEVAKEEYRLALVYIGRIVESLSLMSLSVEMSDWVQTSKTGAKELQEALVSARSNLSRRR
ncbi:hypothetical protein EPN81_02555 [Patescibacteria group bacterium]|nr:MAG: hypothetical protein EPN81_02555 [Patescibacteria group bacterium]